MTTAAAAPIKRSRVMTSITDVPDKVGATDDELVLQSLDGDEAAFAMLVGRHERRVFNILASFVRQTDIREDIAQETFVKAYLSLSTYRRGERFDRWLARIAVNACYDHLRRVQRRQEYTFSDMTEDESLWLETATSHTAEALHVEQQQQAIAKDIADRLLDSLAVEDRMVLVMMERDGYSTEEIADMTGWSKAKVKVRAFRARHQMRQALDRLLAHSERLQKKASSSKRKAVL
ncbi:MAG TPA: sigma-70 family RNA polymerase sigma factor [Blastocatellia bacterium]|nr:sigma-70 family RNA polymerase sigma factor [Blastocatellia bacterium]